MTPFTIHVYEAADGLNKFKLCFKHDPGYIRVLRIISEKVGYDVYVFDYFPLISFEDIEILCKRMENGATILEDDLLLDDGHIVAAGTSVKFSYHYDILFGEPDGTTMEDSWN